MVDAAGVARNAAAGALGGAALGPIGMAVGAVLGAAPGLLDLLGVHLFDPEKGEAVAAKALEAVQIATGKTQPAPQDVADLARSQTDAGVAAMAALRRDLAKIAADQELAAMADTQNARSMEVSFATAKSPIMWAPVVVSTLVVIGFSWLSLLLVIRGIPKENGEVLFVMAGILATAFGQVCNYWLGSSAGSARKTDLLAMAPAIQSQQVKVTAAKR